MEPTVGRFPVDLGLEDDLRRMAVTGGEQQFGGYGGGVTGRTCRGSAWPSRRGR
jgi:hypothetical protein